jgi:hypothetical protein
VSWTQVVGTIQYIEWLILNDRVQPSFIASVRRTVPRGRYLFPSLLRGSLAPCACQCLPWPCQVAGTAVPELKAPPASLPVRWQ